MKRTSHGMILAEEGEKMSKSKGNVVNPDDLIKTYGADTLRMYEMFMGPFDQSVSWNTDSMLGPRRFLERVWKIGQRVASPDPFAQDFLQSNVNHSQQNAGSAVTRLLHKTIKKVSEDIEAMHFNTAISSMMVLLNEMEKSGVGVSDFKIFLQLLHPFAPHITEELWNMFGEKKLIDLSGWPVWDKNLIRDEEIKIVVQVNGKVRAEMMIKTDEDEEEIKKRAILSEIVLKHINGRNAKKVIYVKNRLINIVL